ncbi:Uncharacterised protein [Mycobacteroides abscessus subsp. abscessus]|nr:Uncharacterised protein [Mycobacteroides abscessus subsp. abscessus]SKL79494.1 Uncharacterised protein [Mycobacteroides abscessus subsp. abscessus]SKM53874.1 Uncharacterised protein [Mycobacteroides abscessus subsp. abscessus]SLK35040.1 Uncharacterised protein [Mycobacteroides abscessus subsp. abscessus]
MTHTLRTRATSRIGRAILNHPREDYQVAITLTHGETLLTIPGGRAHSWRIHMVGNEPWLELDFEEAVFL